MPLVAGLHWKSPPKNGHQKKWEGKNTSADFIVSDSLTLIRLSYCLSGTFNMDTPWLYIYTAHKLNQPQCHTLQLTSELTAGKWLTVHNLILEGFYRDRGREKEARLELYTPAIMYLQVRTEQTE